MWAASTYERQEMATGVGTSTTRAQATLSTTLDEAVAYGAVAQAVAAVIIFTGANDQDVLLLVLLLLEVILSTPRVGGY